MNLIQKRLFYERIMRNLKVGDFVTTPIPNYDVDFTSNEVGIIKKCGNKCRVFIERGFIKPDSCGKICFAFKSNMNRYKKGHHLYSCLCSDIAWTHINGKKIYEK